LVQVGEYLFDDHGVFDAGDDLDGAAAVTSGIDVGRFAAKNHAFLPELASGRRFT